MDEKKLAATEYAEGLEAERRALVERPRKLGKAATADQLLQIAVERGDAALIEKMMDLRDRDDATRARKAYIEAVAKFKADPPVLLKRNTFIT